MAKFDVRKWFARNWQIIVVIIIILYLITRIQVP